MSESVLSIENPTAAMVQDDPMPSVLDDARYAVRIVADIIGEPDDERRAARASGSLAWLNRALEPDVSWLVSSARLDEFVAAAEALTRHVAS
jgi:hypothetical protein